MENQILARLSARLTSQQELVATEGLTYILQESDMCRRAVEQLARALGCDLPEIVTYESEIAGENLERPDVVGRADDGSEAVIIEGKFDAGLTDNQPNNYLSRLAVSTPGLLMFVVPELRISNLWRIVTGRAATVCALVNERKLADGSMCVEVGAHHKLLMISWNNLLNCFLQSAQRTSAPIANDILQLMALCARIEGTSFRPFSSEELTSALAARRNRDLCDLADAITSDLVASGLVSIDKLKATAQRHGYVRYVTLGSEYRSSGASIGVDYAAWMQYQVSPLWLASGREATAALRPIFRQVALDAGVLMADGKGSVMLPLDVAPGQEFSDIVASAVDRIGRICRSVADRQPGELSG